ncbi:MAG: NHL repeat-containing protein [Solirubrobacterales bacterium]
MKKTPKTAASAAARLAGAVVFIFGVLALAAPTQAATVSSLGSTGDGPQGIALDSAGNVFTANSTSTDISKLLPGGGGAGIPWPVAVSDPWNVAVDGAGNVFASNFSNNSVSKITPAGALAGGTWPVAIPVNSVPLGIATDQAGNIYTANAGNNTVTKITPDGVATTFASTGGGSSPYALVFDRDGNLYAANNGNDTVSKFSPSGTPAGAPWPVSLGAGANPWAITIDSAGNVYTANDGTDTVSRITAAGTSTSFNVGFNPRGVTVDSAGSVYVVNTGSASVSKITAAGVLTVSFVSGGGLNSPSGLAIDSLGNLFVNNFSNDSVSKITPSGGDIQPAPPDTPAAPSATAGAGSATVNIPANPTDARYGAPTSYSVYSVADPSKACLITAPATSCQVTGLTNGTTYTFAARANLNSWQTGASDPSAAVTPTAPAPTSSVSVKGLKAKLTKKSILITSKATVSGAGKVAQTAKQGKKTWCKASKSATAAATLSLKCKIGKKGRSALKKKALKLSIKTTFTPSVGAAVSTSRKLTIKRKR